MSLPTLEIDSVRFHILEGFYEEVGRRIIPGADWGHNLDAFDDILSGGFGTPKQFILVWVGSQKSRSDLGYPETVRQLKLRLQRCHPESRAHVAGDLAVAKQGQGPTVFDWLIDIIKGHGHISLRLV